jgi:hypothetical protein
LNNVVAFTVARLTPEFPGSFLTRLDSDAHLPPLLTLASLVAIVVLSVLFYQSRVRWVMPDGRVWSPGYVTAEMPPAVLGAVPERLVPSGFTVLLAMVVYLGFVAVLAWEVRGGM